MKKKAAKPTSKKIQPGAPLPPPPPPPLVKGPRVVMAEFKKGYSGPLQLKPGIVVGQPNIQGWRCIAVWDVVREPHQDEQFAEVAEQLGNVKTLYHGTGARNIAAIAEQGLHTGSSACMFGRGIYMGGSAKAYGYCGAMVNSVIYMLEVKAVLGKVYEAPKAEKHTLGSLLKEGFNSVQGVARRTKSWGGTLALDEWVVYSPSQVVVLRVFEFQRTVAFYEKPVEVSGPCALIVKRAPAMDKGNRAFKDVISRVACKNKSYVKVKLDDGQTIWICNHCIERDRLKVGSKVQIGGKRVLEETRRIVALH